MAWRDALCNILEATDQNLRAASIGSHAHPSAVLQKVTEHTYRTDTHAARAEFSSLLSTVQSTLAELKLEVGAAQQLSNRAANQLPRVGKTGVQEHMQWDLYGSSPATSPRISSNTSMDIETSLLRQNAVMRQLQESLAAYGTQVAKVEGQITVNMTDVSQLKSAMTELMSSTQQMQSRADTQHRSDQRTAAQLSQIQQMMQNTNSNLHQVGVAEAGMATRLDTLEHHLQLISAQVGLDTASFPAIQPHVEALPASPQQPSVIQAGYATSASLVQQMRDMRAELSHLQQAQLSTQAHTPLVASTELAGLQGHLEEQSSQVQQLHQLVAGYKQEITVLQTSTAAQERAAAERQEGHQDLVLQVNCVVADLGRHGSDLQSAVSRVEEQQAHVHAQLRQELSQHQSELEKLNTSSTLHDEQSKQHSAILAKHDQRLLSSETLDAETLLAVQSSQGALSGAASNAGQPTSRDTAARMEDRLTALEADLSHTSAANEAMSGIIDQVAQLGEQQVQGCTARITHLETDLEKQVDYLKQQHDDQASSLAGMKAHLNQLTSTQHGSSSGQLAAQMSQLDGRVSKLHTAVAAATQKEVTVELKRDIEVLKDQVQQMHDSHAGQQTASSSLEELERDLASMKTAVVEERASRALANSTASGLQQDLVVLKEQLTQLSISCSEGANDSQQPILKLEHKMAELSATVLQLTKQADGHHVQAATVEALQHDMSGLKAELAQLQSRHSAAETHAELYSRLECDIAATKDQLSSLRLHLTQHASQQPWQDESDKLRSELAACVKAASSTDVVVARHDTDLSRLDSCLAELHAKASTASQTCGQAKGACESEVEDLNERLFELRVEVQNLDENTGISIASITRKAELAEQHAEEASEAAAACKEALQAAQGAAAQAESTQTSQSASAAAQHTQQQSELRQLFKAQQEQLAQQGQLAQQAQQEQLHAQQQRTAELSHSLTQVQQQLHLLQSTSEESGNAKHAQHSEVKRLAAQCTDAQQQVVDLQSRLKTDAQQHLDVQKRHAQQLASQHETVLSQLQAVQSRLGTPDAQSQQLAEQYRSLQQQLQAVKDQACSAQNQCQQQHGQLQGELKALQSQANASTSESGESWREIKQRLGDMQVQVQAGKQRQAEVQAIKQTTSSLTSQLAGMTEQVSKLQQQRPAASHGSDDSSGDSAFKHRLRKIELTVADALTEVASQMKALELRVTALSSARQSSPTAAEAPATARSIDSGHHQADSASSISFNKVVGGPLVPITQAEQQSSSSAALSGQPSQAEHGKVASASAPKAAAGGATTDRAAAGRAVPSSGPQGSALGTVSLVPDLMSFSPAVSTRQTGLNQQPSGMLLNPIGSLQYSQQEAPSFDAASGVLNSAHVAPSKPQAPSQQRRSSHALVSGQQHQASSSHALVSGQQHQANSSHALVSGQQHHVQPSDHAAQVIPTQHGPSPQHPEQLTGTQHLDRSQLAGACEKASSVPQSPSLLDSCTGSPLPRSSFYDNAVFGSPTPTPSPQRDALGSEPSLLSPGSSPRPQHLRGQLHPSTLGSKPAEGSDSASVSGLSVHHNQLWTHDADSISIPTAAAAASLGITGVASGVPHVAGRKPQLAPLPVVRGGTSPAVTMLSQQSGNVLPSTAGVGGTEHSPGVSLNTTFQLTGQSLLDDSESSSADEEEVGHQLSVIQQQLARDDIDEWERDILMSEWDLLSKVRHIQTPQT